MTSTETRPDPAVMRVTVTPGDVDVTEGVRTLYDLVISSMNWGSGFLSIEDVEGVIRVAQTCGFLVPDEAAREFEEYAQALSPFWAYGGHPALPPRQLQWRAESRIRCVECGAPVAYLRDQEPNRWVHQVMPDGIAEPHPVVLWRSYIP
jgi:hypothetical protein